MKISFKRFFAVTLACVCTFSSAAFAQKTSTILFDNKCNQTSANSVPDDAIVISVLPSKDQLSVGDEFYVDFVLKNNPGFAAFAFTVDYDKDVIVPIKSNDYSADDELQVIYERGAVMPSDGINRAIETGKSSGSLVYADILLNGLNTFTSRGDGLFFRINFKAVGAGNSDIVFSDRLKNILVNETGKNYSDIYVENASVSVNGDDTASADNQNSENKVTTETITETVTETTTEAESKKTENNIDEKTENNKEVTTKKTEDNTEIATENVESVIGITTESQENTDNSFTINIPVNISEPKKFDDIRYALWAEDDILSLTSLGIINGISDTLFNPKAYTYRADFVIVISKLLGLNGQAENVFFDVKSSDYFAQYVALANKFDIVKGFDGKFMPKSNITRQDAMLIIHRVLEKAGKVQKGSSSELNKFADYSSISSYAVSAMTDLVSMGVVKGDDKNMLNPKGYINRAEMAVVVHRVYNILK